MRQEQDRLLGMIDLPISQAWLVLPDQSNAIVARNVLCSDDYKFAPLQRSTKRNIFYDSPGNLAANGRAIEHSRQRHVVNVACRPGYFVAAILARHRPADDVLFRHAKSPQYTPPTTGANHFAWSTCGIVNENSRQMTIESVDRLPGSPAMLEANLKTSGFS
jgi:hypothetical protein